MTRSARDTPMMRQYLAVKAKHPDAIVFYRMGDFYEMFLDDAVVAAPLLDIALTTRDRAKEDAVPMCGIPVHAADPHIKRLAELGHRVAICEQVEDARATGGRRLVKREVVEVVTPGLVGDPEGLDAASELCIAALAVADRCGLAVLEASTGALRVTEAALNGDGLPSEIAEELLRIGPREVLFVNGAEAIAKWLDAALPDAARTELLPSSFEPGELPAQPEGFDPTDTGAGTRAAAALLRYVADHQPAALTHTCRLVRYGLSETMILDASTRAHLELFRNGEDGGRQRTLIERIDQTTTPLGARRLARWLAYPLVDPHLVRERQDEVASWVERDRPRARLRTAIKAVRDLERLLAKAARSSSTPRDLAALRASLEALPDVAAAATDTDESWLDGSTPAQARMAAPEPVDDIAILLREALVDDPPIVAKGSRGANETGYIREGYRTDLDVVRGGTAKARDWIAGFEARERERTGISNLKIRFHPVHGYAIEVSKSQLSRVPDDYRRKQTLANAERFTTDELADVEQGVRTGTEQAAALERTLFDELRTAVLQRADAIARAADAVADLDAAASLAEVGRRDGWVRPVVDDGVGLVIRGGRHPVVEPLLQLRGDAEFVPNDTEVDADGTQILILTGPNMSGKSTYLRQVAQIVLLAQMGSFVPAEEASIGVVDRVFTRVGASDRLARGESTFMVEMRETSEILANATRRSLVILDEIGRGTSTFDGLSIAWAVAEHLHDAAGLGPRTLFATHYHELADLARTKARVRNAHFEAREWGEEVVFLRRLRDGAANRSYGIQVARLAGLPRTVIERARAILANLEGGELDPRGRPRLAGEAETEADPATDQLGLFAPAPLETLDTEVLATLRDVDPDQTTPIEALTILSELVRRLRGEQPS